jgi:hypothetical protein
MHPRPPATRDNGPRSGTHDIDVLFSGELDLDQLIAHLEAASQPSMPAPGSPKAAASDRRAARRLSREDVREDLRVTVGGGHAATLVDVSATGMFLETTHRLCPGHTTDVYIRCGDERRTLRGTILRCRIEALSPCPIYRAALRFDREILVPERAA